MKLVLAMYMWYQVELGRVSLFLGLKRHPKPPREIVALLHWKPPVQSSLITHGVF